jgi:flagellar protein FliO/FliZ
MEIVEPLRIVFSFGLVIGLIGVCVLGLRYLARKNPQWLMAQQSGRLQVVEMKMIDARRKLVLIKRDEQEHLLLLSPTGELLIEKVEPHA